MKKQSWMLLCGAAVIGAGCAPWLIQSSAKETSAKPVVRTEDVAAKTSFALQTGVHVCGVGTCDHDHKNDPIYKASRAKYDAIIKPGIQDRTLGPVSACFHPDTPPATVAAFMDALRNASDGAWPDPNGANPEYFIGTGWSGTSVTWSFVPDGLSIGGSAGEPTGPSDLFARMDSLFAAQGGRPTWIARFQAIFDRWEQLTGVDFTRVTSGGNDWDDGQPWGTGGNSSRGAIRISMKNIDGTNGILAYNFFPTNGDMVIDRSENWSSSSNFHRFLRNTVAHENGHGMAIGHVCSNNSAQLMEPFLSTAFDGPQHDDIRAMQRLYGDANEPNPTTASATSLGVLALTNALQQYGDVPADPTHPTMPIPTNSSLFSLATSTDNDYYSFSIAGSADVTVTVLPIGFSYDNNGQLSDGSCPSGSTINSLAQGDLQFQVIGTNGTTVLTTRNATAIGLSETLTLNLPAAGTYFLRVYPNGAVPTTQMYKVQLTGTAVVVNQPPVMGTVGNRTINEGVLTTQQITATDPNSGQTLTWSLTNAPSGMTISASGLISWTPTEAQGFGNYTFTVNVADNGSPILSDFETVTWTVSEVNQAPVLTVPAGTINVIEGNTATFTATATDADLPANTLSYSLVSPPAGASINPTTGFFSFTPGAGQVGGLFNIQVRVQDNGTPFLSDTETVTIQSVITNKTLNGTVTLSDYLPDEAGKGYTLTITNVGSSSALVTINDVFGAAGSISEGISGLPAGTYDVYVKSSHWLRKVTGSVVFSTSGANFTTELVNGDSNLDNEVGPADFSVLSSAFGSFLGDANFNANADLNGDNEVGPADFSILAARFGTFGD